jgi:hypothetical protein
MERSATTGGLSNRRPGPATACGVAKKVPLVGVSFPDQESICKINDLGHEAAAVPQISCRPADIHTSGVAHNMWRPISGDMGVACAALLRSVGGTNFARMNETTKPSPEQHGEQTLRTPKILTVGTRFGHTASLWERVFGNVPIGPPAASEDELRAELREAIDQAVQETVQRLKPAPEEAEAIAILDHVERDLPAIEQRTERLLYRYGL